MNWDLLFEGSVLFLIAPSGVHGGCIEVVMPEMGVRACVEVLCHEPHL